MPIMTPTGPGIGDGWTRLTASIRDTLPISTIDRLWVFRPIRHQAKEFGTAIISLVTGDRRRIVTARYILTIKSKSRGAFSSEISEVGTGPIEALDELLALVPKRSDDEEPPVPIPVERWFPPEEASGGSDQG